MARFCGLPEPLVVLSKRLNTRKGVRHLGGDGWRCRILPRPPHWRGARAAAVCCTLRASLLALALP
eukprot:5387929-Prymnesium_polylepis.1